MIFDSVAVVALQNLLVKRDFSRLSSWTITGFKLGAVIELACFDRLLQEKNDIEASALLLEWSKQHSILSDAVSALRHRGLRPVSYDDIFGNPEYEIFPVPLHHQWQAPQWDNFQERFSRSLRLNGFDRKLALALSKAMAEMADNVIQHSGGDKDHQADAVVGFHTASRCMTFSIADVGRGVLASLRTNPRWQSLPNSTEALAVIVDDGATRRIEEPRGDGFRLVLNSIADYNGYLWFRSGGGSYTLDGRGDHRQATKGYVPSMPGLQVSVTCSLDETINDMVI